ncbi:Ribonuclease H-like superfamily [Sesbania bispinosa]|nr:Ribonuclease H-like superfamily [Sesbania bispinosa]
MANGLFKDPIWKKVWSWSGPHKLRSFLWMILKGGLKTNSFRSKGGISDSPLCPCCGAFPESQIRILRDCHYAHQIWYLLKVDNADLRFFSRDIHSWIASNLDGHSTALHQAPWSTVFVNTVFSIWSSRNEYVFKANLKYADYVAHLAKAKACDYSRVYTNPTSSSQSTLYGTLMIKWTLPPPGILKYNVDALVNIHDSSAACGGTIRDCSGRWIAGFVKNIGQSSVNMAELWGIFTALQLGLHISVPDIWVEFDSMPCNICHSGRL